MIPTEAGVFGGHTEFGTKGRYWDFRSLGRGNINFEEIIRALEHVLDIKVLYQSNGKTVEWIENMEQWRLASMLNLLIFLRQI